MSVHLTGNVVGDQVQTPWPSRLRGDRVRGSARFSMAQRTAIIPRLRPRGTRSASRETLRLPPVITRPRAAGDRIFEERSSRSPTSDDPLGDLARVRSGRKRRVPGAQSASLPAAGVWEPWLCKGRPRVPALTIGAEVSGLASKRRFVIRGPGGRVSDSYDIKGRDLATGAHFRQRASFSAHMSGRTMRGSAAVMQTLRGAGVVCNSPRAMFAVHI